MPLVDCPDCGATVSERASACPSCGCPTDLTPCEDCGELLGPDHEACFTCGAPVPSAARKVLEQATAHLREGLTALRSAAELPASTSWTAEPTVLSLRQIVAVAAVRGVFVWLWVLPLAMVGVVTASTLHTSAGSEEAENLVNTLSTAAALAGLASLCWVVVPSLAEGASTRLPAGNRIRPITLVVAGAFLGAGSSLPLLILLGTSLSQRSAWVASGPGMSEMIVKSLLVAGALGAWGVLCWGLVASVRRRWPGRSVRGVEEAIRAEGLLGRVVRGAAIVAVLAAFALPPLFLRSLKTWEPWLLLAGPAFVLGTFLLGCVLHLASRASDHVLERWLA
jgi:hypothetical protein